MQEMLRAKFIAWVVSRCKSFLADAEHGTDRIGKLQVAARAKAGGGAARAANSFVPVPKPWRDAVSKRSYLQVTPAPEIGPSKPKAQDKAWCSEALAYRLCGGKHPSATQTKGGGMVSHGQNA